MDQFQENPTENKINPNDVDITEKLGFDSAFDELYEATNKNMSETQKNLTRKINELIHFRELYLQEDIARAELERITDLHTGLITFCRNKCESTAEDISNNEKRCLKTCANKYLKQLNILNNSKAPLLKTYGYETFVFLQDMKETLSKMNEMIKNSNKL